MRDTVHAVGAIVLAPDDLAKVVIIRRGRPPNEGAWTLPGGHVEAGETWEHAVRREVMEETGLTVRVVAFTETFTLHAPHATYAIHEHLCVLEEDAEGYATPATLRPGDDAAEAIWASLDELERRGVAPEARDVILRAVATTRDKKGP